MSNGFYVQQDGDIYLHTFTDSAEESIDAWAGELSRLIECTPPGELFRVLMDVSSPQVSFSRHARQTSMRLFSHYRQHKGRFAFLFSSKAAPFYSRIFFASLGKLDFSLEYFSSRDKALDWLRH